MKNRKYITLCLPERVRWIIFSRFLLDPATDFATAISSPNSINDRAKEEKKKREKNKKPRKDIPTCETQQYKA